MHDAAPETRPTARPPSRVRQAREPHPYDGERPCKRCGVVHHYFEGTQIQARETEHVWEVRFMTCASCSNTVDVPHTVRLDLDGESHGAVIERRPSDARDAEVAEIVALLRGAA